MEALTEKPVTRIELDSSGNVIVRQHDGTIVATLAFEATFFSLNGTVVRSNYPLFGSSGLQLAPVGPTDPRIAGTSYRCLFLDSTNGDKLSIRNTDGTVVCLE